MKKIISLFLIGFFTSSANASIPYCSGTQVTGDKSRALQNVISTFALENKCIIGTNCILNFNSIKYSIAWSQDCIDSAKKGNDPKGSTFVCSEGTCNPLGFRNPKDNYDSSL